VKALLRILTLGIIASGAVTAAAQTAQSGNPVPPAQQKFYYHYEWTRGAVVSSQEWKRGAPINHPRHDGLPVAPRGDEWVEIDRNYVLASKSTHAIVRVVAAPHPTVPGRSGGEQ
jgi:Ni/Co efflux regulator RcnB